MEKNKEVKKGQNYKLASEKPGNIGFHFKKHVPSSKRRVRQPPVGDQVLAREVDLSGSTHKEQILGPPNMSEKTADVKHES